MTTTTAAPTPGIVTDAQRSQYDEDGFLILRDFFSSAQIADLACDAEALLRRTELIHTDNLRCRWKDHAQTKECLFETFDPVNDLSPACARISTDPRLLAAVSALYGEEACLFKDKLIFKPPGAKGYGLHQDYIAWAGFPRTFVTVLVPIDSATEGNGCTEVFAGYHKNGTLSPRTGITTSWLWSRSTRRTASSSNWPPATSPSSAGLPRTTRRRINPTATAGSFT